jgi:hypothetical protein
VPSEKFLGINDSIVVTLEAAVAVAGALSFTLNSRIRRGLTKGFGR